MKSTNCFNIVLLHFLQISSCLSGMIKHSENKDPGIIIAGKFYLERDVEPSLKLILIESNEQISPVAKCPHNCLVTVSFHLSTGTGFPRAVVIAQSWLEFKKYLDHNPRSLNFVWSFAKLWGGLWVAFNLECSVNLWFILSQIVTLPLSRNKQ